MSEMGAETLVDLLERAAEHPATGLRFLDRHEVATWLGWDELYARARKMAGGLRELGLRSGERVALVYSTGPEFFEAFFGVVLTGAVPVPLYPPLRLGRSEEYHPRTARLMRAAGARLVLAEARLLELLEPTLALAEPPLGGRALGEISAQDAAPVRPGAQDLALVQLSSGTTVDPKPVALSHRALLAQAKILNSFWPDTPELHHSGVSWLPLYHDMGLIGCVFPTLERPTVLTLFAPEIFVARPAVWLRAISSFGATISVAPNFAYGLCTERIRDEELEGVDLSSWRVALNGSEAVAPAVLHRFRERFACWGLRPEALTPVYGLSEAALAVTFSALDRPFLSVRFNRELLARERRAVLDPAGMELVSVGRPVPGFELELRDETGAALGESQVGHVWIRGPSLMDGYLDRPEATAEVLQDGWLDTGDLGFLFRGELYLTGRAKDLVILRGRNYSPTEIEHAICEVAGLHRDAAVAASWLSEGAATETLFLFVEHTRGLDEEALASLPQSCTEAVLAAVGLRLDEVVVLPPGTLPRTSSGKLRRRETLERHLAGEPSPPAPLPEGEGSQKNLPPVPPRPLGEGARG